MNNDYLGYLKAEQTIASTAVSTNTTTAQANATDVTDIDGNLAVEYAFLVTVTGYSGDRVFTPELKFSDNSDMSDEVSGTIHQISGDSDKTTITANGSYFIPVVAFGGTTQAAGEDPIESKRYVTLDLTTTGSTGGGTVDVKVIAKPRTM